LGELKLVYNVPCTSNTLPISHAPQFKLHSNPQWRTEGGFGGFKSPPRNSEDIGGVLDRMSKKNWHLDFLL